LTAEIGNVDIAYLSPGLNLSDSPLSLLTLTWSWVGTRLTMASEGTASGKGVVWLVELLGTRRVYGAFFWDLRAGLREAGMMQES
jgi:hypothetical protein